MRLKFIKIDVENNTIEANWFEDTFNEDGELISSTSVKCENYSDKDRFISEVEGADKYVGLVDWTMPQAPSNPITDSATSASI